MQRFLNAANSRILEIAAEFSEHRENHRPESAAAFSDHSRVSTTNLRILKNCHDVFWTLRISKWVGLEIGRDCYLCKTSTGTCCPMADPFHMKWAWLLHFASSDGKKNFNFIADGLFVFLRGLQYSFWRAETRSWGHHHDDSRVDASSGHFGIRAKIRKWFQPESTSQQRSLDNLNDPAACSYRQSAFKPANSPHPKNPSRQWGSAENNR